MKYVNIIFNIICKVIVIGFLITYAYVSLKYKNLDDWFNKHKYYQGKHTVNGILPDGSIGYTSEDINYICPKDLEMKLKIDAVIFNNKRAFYSLNKCYLNYGDIEKIAWLLLAEEKDMNTQFLNDFYIIRGSLDNLYNGIKEFRRQQIIIKKYKNTILIRKKQNKNSFVPSPPYGIELK